MKEAQGKKEVKRVANRRKPKEAIPQDEPIPTSKQSNKLFHNLEEDRIRLEEEQRERAEKEKARREEIERIERESKSHEPSLQCPFCQNIQYEASSRDPTTAWCLKCGRAFALDWK